MDKILKRAVAIILFLVCFVAVFRIWIYQDRYQWDFAANSYAAGAYFSGLDPYDTKVVSGIAGKKLLPSVYAPFALSFFGVFTRIDYGFAYHLYFLLKCAALLVLILLWRNWFLDKQVDLIFYILCAFAFNLSIYLDLRAGNIAIFEQLAVWLAFGLYLKRKYLWFCALIVFTATFKIQPLLLLALLLLSGHRKRHLYLLCSLAVFACLYLLPFANRPELFHSLIFKTGGLLRQGGIDNPIDNPSTLWFIQDILKIFSRLSGIMLSSRFHLGVYLAVIIAVLLISARALRYLAMSGLKDKEKWMIFFVCLVYALVSPRFKNYSYIILIVPTYFIIKRSAHIKTYIFIFFLAIIPSFPQTFSHFGSFYTLIIAYALWAMYLNEIFLMQKHNKKVSPEQEV